MNLFNILFNSIADKAILLLDGTIFSLALIIVLWFVFLIFGTTISFFTMFDFSSKSADKIIDESIISRYSKLRAISIIIFIVEFAFAAFVSKIPFASCYYVLARIVTVALFIIILLLYLNYKSIVRPLLTNIETNKELKIHEDKIIDYKHDVNEYRKLMNLIFTLISLLLLVLIIFYLSIPDLIKPKNLGNFKDILSYFSIPAFGASILLIFNTEQKLENIYWTYFPTEYNEYINNYFSKK